MKRILMAAFFLFPAAEIATAQDVSIEPKVNAQTVIDAINADIAATAAEEAAAPSAAQKRKEERLAGCTLLGEMVQDIVTRKKNGETLEAVQAVIEADPAYETVPRRDMLPMRIEMAFNLMGGMAPEDANAMSVRECNKT
jgi:hypothetical protein